MYSRLSSLSIRAQLFLIVFIMALPAAGIIIYSGIKLRNDAVAEARTQTQILADRIASKQRNLVAATRQLMVSLAHLPEIRNRNAARVQPLLEDILKLNPIYSNIFIAGLDGKVWAAAIPAVPSLPVSDRRYFRNALASGGLSSGEYIINRATLKPGFNLGYPLRNDDGETVGVLSVGFVLDLYRNLAKNQELPEGTGYLLLDHRGVVLDRATDPENFVGRSLEPELFREMLEGPDEYTGIGRTMAGDTRIHSYRKLRLENETAPYMYIRAGIPLDVVRAKANRSLAGNLLMFTSFLLLSLYIASRIGKRSIVDRVASLEAASKRLADGDLQVRVSDLVEGGELGRLGKTFDHMAGELASREQALLASEKNYREIFDATEDAIFLHHAETGKILEVNRSVEGMYGFSREEMLTLSAEETSSGEPPYSVREAAQWIRKTIEEGPQSFEWLARRKNGERFWAEVTLTATGIGGEGRVLAVVRDITDRKRSEEEKRKLQSQLLHSQKMESIGQLAGGIAHDFNNILTAIIGYGAVLQMKMPADDPNRTYVDQVLAGAERAAGLTQSLLAFSRKQVINPKPMDVNDAIRRLSKFLSRILGEDIEMITTLSDEPLTVVADSTQIEQVLMNIAANARDAMPGGGRFLIETGRTEFHEEYLLSHGYAKPGAYAVLSITDTGVGMDRNIQEKIFEPFFTTKEVGKGTGLGLPIVYGIVKQHDGYINVYSEVGKGTTFRIYLRLVRTGEPEAEPAAEPDLPRGGSETVLLAEDDREVRLLVKNVLIENGYTVIEAADGEEALKKFMEHKDRIQMLFSDVIMPRKNGSEKGR